MGNIHIDARISSFIHRKLATMGESVEYMSRDATKSSGIYYEPMVMPRRASRKV